MTKRDRSGRTVSLSEWANLWSDLDYRIVADDTVCDVRVRTVWQGIDEVPDSTFFTGIAVAGEQFETIASAATEEQARQRHQQALDLLGEDATERGLVHRLRSALADSP